MEHPWIKRDHCKGLEHLQSLVSVGGLEEISCGYQGVTVYVNLCRGSKSICDLEWNDYFAFCNSSYPVEPSEEAVQMIQTCKQGWELMLNTTNEVNQYNLVLRGSRSYHQRRQWPPTPVLLPGKSHGQRSLVGCNPWGCKESDTTERLNWTELISLPACC